MRADDASVLERLDNLLFPFRPEERAGVRSRNQFVLATTRPGDERHHAYRDCRRLARSDSWTEVFDPVLAEINRRAIEEMDYFGTHAGVVSIGDRTIAFPADSGEGKSTLVAACLQAGFEYVSDEALCLDYGDASVISYPKPLNLSRWSLERLGLSVEEEVTTKVPVAPTELGAIAVLLPRMLTDVVLLERMSGTPSLERLPTSSAMAALLTASFNHYKRPAETYALISKVASATRASKIAYDEPKRAARLLLTTFG